MQETNSAAAANAMSAYSCGCDPGCGEGYHCGYYPDCVGGVIEQTMEAAAQVLGTAPIFASTVPSSKGVFTLATAQQEIAGAKMLQHERHRELIEDGRDVLKGIGGAPSRASTLPTDSTARKGFPIVTGVLDYFPDALLAVAQVSQLGNDQHNPGQPLHWDRAKSTDEANTLGRHLLQRGTLDSDGMRHSAKVAWRALAMLQKEIEAERAAVA